jgi:hypothetical protein
MAIVQRLGGRAVPIQPFQQERDGDPDEKHWPDPTIRNSGPVSSVKGASKAILVRILVSFSGQAASHHLATFTLKVTVLAPPALLMTNLYCPLWSDFNWLLREIFIPRSLVEGYEDETKSESSNLVCRCTRRLWRRVGMAS